MSDDAPPIALAEHKRKRKGDPGAWHFLIRTCPFCGASHSHATAGLQPSHCVRGPALYNVVPSTEGGSMDTTKRDVPQDQIGLIPPVSKRGNTSSIDPGNGAPAGSGLPTTPPTRTTPFPIVDDPNR